MHQRNKQCTFGNKWTSAFYIKCTVANGTWTEQTAQSSGQQSCDLSQPLQPSAGRVGKSYFFVNPENLEISDITMIFT